MTHVGSAPPKRIAFEEHVEPVLLDGEPLIQHEFWVHNPTSQPVKILKVVPAAPVRMFKWMMNPYCQESE